MTLLGVDAAVIRMPDERGIELVARAVKVNDERVRRAAMVDSFGVGVFGRSTSGSALSQLKVRPNLSTPQLAGL